MVEILEAKMTDLFSLTKTPKSQCDRPLAHRDDPITSYEAADRMVKSGALNRQEERVLDAIKCYKCSTWKEDFTAKELSNISSINYYTIQRRLSGLHNKGKIERTGEKRDGCCVWKLK